MLIRGALVALLVALWLFTTAAPSSATGRDTPEMLLEKILAVERCFEDRIGQSSPRAPIGGFTRMFLFDHLTRMLPATSQSREQGPSIDELCRSAISTYRGARGLAAAEQRASAAGSLAPLGTSAIESQRAFIEAAHNVTGRHARGHYDITLEALRALGPQLRLSDVAIEFVARASQSPDLYAWNDGRYHAHADEYQSDAADREARIAEGRGRFRQLLTKTIADLKRHADVGGWETALFALGIASHAVQDLVYHRGMTMRQHSGLSYAVGRNPDFPHGEDASKRWNEAVALTPRVVRAARAEVSDRIWENLIAWRAPTPVDFQDVARRFFPAGEDISLRSLTAYWLLSLPYQSGARRTMELAQSPDCSQPRGLACWIPAEVLYGVLPE